MSVALPADVSAQGAAARASGAERQRAAAGWLRLESDQRVERERASPLTPLESQQLQSLEQRERARYREQLQREQRELRDLHREERWSAAETTGGRSPESRLRGRLLEQQRSRDALELRRRMDRRSQDSLARPMR